MLHLISFTIEKIFMSRGNHKSGIAVIRFKKKRKDFIFSVLHKIACLAGGGLFCVQWL